METHGGVQRTQSRAPCAFVGASHKDKRQQTQVAASKVLIRETCLISDELPHGFARCHTRLGALASSPQRLHPSFSLLGGKQYQGDGSFQRPLSGNSTTSPSRHGRRRAPSKCPRRGPTLPSLPQEMATPATGQAASAVLPTAGLHGGDRNTSHQTRPRERRAAIGRHGSARGAAGPGSSSTPSAPRLLRGLRLHRAESERDPSRGQKRT